MKTKEAVNFRQHDVPVFVDIYSEQCQKFYVCPRRAVISKLIEGNALDLSADVIRSDDWKPLLQALRLDHSLTKIALCSSFLSNYPSIVADVPKLQLVRKIQKDIHIPPLLTPDIFHNFCFSLCAHLKNNTHLKTLSLQGFPFTVAQLQQLSSAIHHSKSVRHLCFNGCPFGRQHVEAICHGLRGTWKPRVLSLNGCQIDNTSAEALASLLQLQAIQLHGVASSDGVHEQPLSSDSVVGLRRLSLCNNPLGDEGVVIILAALNSDPRLKALDFQNCSIGNTGAEAVLDVLSKRCSLEVIDLRRNPRIDPSLIKEIENQIKENGRGRKCKFHLLPLEKASLVTVAQHRVRSRSVGHGDQGKHGKRNHGRSRSEERNQEPFHNMRMKPTYAASTRVAAIKPIADNRIINHNKENVSSTISTGAQQLEKQLLACQEELKKERELRLHSEKLLMEMFEENRQLRAENKAFPPDGYVVVETSLMDAVENTIVRFCQYLEISRNKSMPLGQKHLELQSNNIKTDRGPALLGTAGKHEASGAIPKTKQALAAAKRVDIAARNSHEANDSGHKRNEALGAPAGTAIITQNVPSTSRIDRHTSVDASLLQDFISSKAQKLASELRSKWNRSSSEKSSISKSNHLKLQGEIQNGVSPLNSKWSPPTSIKRRKDHVETGAQHAHETQSDHPSDVLSLSLEENSKRLSELLNIEPIPSKLAQSVDTSQVFYPPESESAGYRSDDFLSSISASSSVREGSKKHLVSKEKGRESSASSLSGTSLSKQSSMVLSKRSNAGSAVIKEKVNSLSAAQKCSQDTSITLSMNEEIASAHTLSSQQNSSMNIPVTTLSSAATDTGKVQSTPMAVPLPEAAEHRKMQSTLKVTLSTTPSVNLSQSVSKSFDFATADITVSSMDSISKHFNERSLGKQSLYHNFGTPPFEPGNNNGRAVPGMSDTVRTPSDITLSRNNSSISTPSTPETLTSPRLAGSDFDDF